MNFQEPYYQQLTHHFSGRQENQYHGHQQYQDDNILGEIEDREEKTFNVFIVPGMNYKIHS